MTSRHIRDLANRAWNQGICCFTNFLDLKGISDFYALLPSLPKVPWRLFGGAEGCERQMLRFGDEDGRNAEFPIACLRIRPVSEKFSETLTHRDYLGALMALGMERELLGDIAVREKEAYLFCLKRVAPYICEHFTQARRTNLTCEPVSQLPDGPLYAVKQLTVQLSSQRLDALIARVFQLSRGDAQALFPAGRVYVDGRLCMNSEHAPREGDVVSIRCFGRFRYAGVGSLSKKGKENTAVDLYV